MDLLWRAESLVDDVPGTLSWFAFRTGPQSVGIFDVFGNSADRETYLYGEIRNALETEGQGRCARHR